MKGLSESNELWGYWFCESYGSFRMFIDSRKPLTRNKFEIEGRTKDCIGGAKFQGTISPEEIEFTKRYEKTLRL